MVVHKEDITVNHQLTLQEKQVIQLYFIQEQSHQEIAKTIGVGAERVRQIKAKAIRKISMDVKAPKPISKTLAWRKHHER